MSNNKNMGDLWTNMQERYNQRDQVAFSDWGKIEADILRDTPPSVPPEKVDEMVVLARVLEHVFAKTLFLAKEPAHLEPPFRAIPIDMYKNNSLLLPPVVGWVQALRLTIRPGQIAIIKRIGNECENLAAHEEVQWTVRINGQDLIVQTEWFDGAGARDSSYRNFNERLGMVDDPFELPNAFTILGPADLQLLVQNTSLINPHRIRARITGYMFTPGRTSLDRESPVQIMS